MTRFQFSRAVGFVTTARILKPPTSSEIAACSEWPHQKAEKSMYQNPGSSLKYQILDTSEKQIICRAPQVEHR